jgi:hypothetical protein
MKDFNNQIRIFCLFSGDCEINFFLSFFSVFVYLEAGACEVKVPIACAQCLEEEDEEDEEEEEKEEEKKEEEVSRKKKRGSGCQ